MNTSLRLFLELFLLSIFYWISAFAFFIIIKYYGINDQMLFFSEEKINFPFQDVLISALFIGLAIGFVYTIVEWCFDKFLSAKLILGLSIIIKSVIYFVIIVILFSIARSFIESQIDLNLTLQRGWWHSNKTFWSSILFFIFASIIFSFIRIVNNKFGPGVFFNMLLGKYKKPKEETRILMFLDLKDSTAIAEKLGHVLYSNFIQDCFIDLNNVIAKYDAEIYQYVGDEAVISWTQKKGFRNKNCIKLYFAFKKRLLKREKYYLKNYNFQPHFKAGLHYGRLIIAEVGLIKKEIAYHGDVINTAARIQAECNTYNAPFLISEAIKNNMYLSENYIEDAVGAVLLKGKIKTINIFSINEKQ